MSDVSVPVMRRKLPLILSSPEITPLLRSTNGQREYAILAVLLVTGMRVGELAPFDGATVGSEPDWFYADDDKEISRRDKTEPEAYVDRALAYLEIGEREKAH